MSQDRQKDDAPAPRAVGAPASAANPGRSTLTNELGEGDGLPYRQRSLFERSTGADLSGVRVHTGDAAADAATGVGARAYAVGQNIVFNRGQYQPDTPEGDALLAHEVAHTVQQGHAQGTGALATTSPGDRAEAGADDAASSMLAGAPTNVEAQPVAIARKMMDERVDAPAFEPQARGIDDGGAPRIQGEPGKEGAPGTEGEPGTAKTEGDEAGGDLTAERVGQEEEEGTEPVGPPQNLEQGKQDLAAKAGGGEGAVEGGGAGVEGGGAAGLEGAAGGGGGEGPAPDAGGGGDGGGVASPELVAAVEGAQSDAQEAQSQAKGESEAFQAEMKAQRDQFDAQQMAITRDKLATMSPADKRSTLIEMGWDKKKVKKLKDHELDGIIEGKFETEARKSKIMGMTPEELAELSPAQKVQHLVDLGIDKKDLDKIGQQKACKAFDDIMRLAHVPGKHKVKIKVKGGFFNKKEWHVKINVDAEGNADITPEKKGGFFSKLWGWVKALLPIILTVLGPITGGISLIVLAVYQTVVAIQTGDWLGAVIGIAGAFVGLGALKAVQNSVGAIAKGLKKVADIAKKVKKIADAAKQAMTAAQAKNPGSLLAAIAQGASAFASFGAKFADKFSIKMDQWSVKLDKWAGIIRGGEKVLQGVKSGDPLMAIGGAFETASAAVDGKSQTGKNLTRAANITNFASVGKRALQARPPDYAAVAEAALGIAGQLKEDRRIDDAARIVGSANRLRQAIATGDAGAIAQAGLELAQAIQVAKYDADNKEEKDKDGNPLPDEKRDAIIARYTKAQNVVRAADTLIKAASARPRPNYIAALDAVTQMVAELTESKRIDQAAVISSAFSRWTSAVNSKNPQEIFDAAKGLGEAINGMRDLINKEREDAKKEAEQQLGPGETLPTGDAGELGQITPGDLAPGTEPAPGEEPLPTSGRDVGDLMPGAPGVRPGDLGTEPTGPGPQPAAPRLNPRGNTPNANYTVFSGDSLGRISQAFGISVAELRSLNPQIVNSQIFAGQKLFVPGAEVVPEGTVTTEEQYSVDPAVVEAQRKQEVDRARGVIRTWNAQIRDWNATRSMGADFYVYVREFSRQVDTFDRMLASPTTTVSTIKSMISFVSERFRGVNNLFQQRSGQKELILNFSIFALECVRDGAGIALSVLDRSRLISAGYQGVIAAVDEYAKGGSGRAMALRGLIAAIIEVVPDKASGGMLQSAVNEAFREAANAINEYCADVARNGDMTAKEKRELQAKYLAKVPTWFAVGAVKGRLDAINEGAKASKLKELVDETLYEMVKKATDTIIGG